MDATAITIAAILVPTVSTVIGSVTLLSNKVGKWNGNVTTEIKHLSNRINTLETNCDSKMRDTHQRIDDIVVGK